MIDQHMERMLDPELIDKYGFIDLETADFWFLSKKEIDAGILPATWRSAIFVPSAFLSSRKILRYALNNDFFGSIGWNTCNQEWSFIPNTCRRWFSQKETAYKDAQGWTESRLCEFLGLSNFDKKSRNQEFNPRLPALNDLRKIAFDAMTMGDHHDVFGCFPFFQAFTGNSNWALEENMNKSKNRLIMNFKHRPTASVYHATFPYGIWRHFSTSDENRPFASHKRVVTCLDALENVAAQRPLLNQVLNEVDDDLDEEDVVEKQDAHAAINQLYGLLIGPLNPYPVLSSMGCDHISSRRICEFYRERHQKDEDFHQCWFTSESRAIEHFGASMYDLIMELAIGPVSIRVQNGRTHESFQYSINCLLNELYGDQDPRVMDADFWKSGIIKII